MMPRRLSLSPLSLVLSLVALTSTLVHALHYDPGFKDHNLNSNKTAISPLDYWGQRDPSHRYFPSPENWRAPYYTVFLDRFVNGDPTNDNANGTVFETDSMTTQLRNGGDLQGLIDSLDYVAGMGVKVIYIAGSPFINQPWGADAYSPLDLTLLDAHAGTIATWQQAVDEIHSRGMYVLLDNTMATLGDLIGFEGYLNSSTPFDVKEHHVKWKTSRQYLDFQFGNTYNETCDYPPFWYEDGTRIYPPLKGCYNSDFDQYGDIEAFGVFPDWQRQLAKFASVQDRLRDWNPKVRSRLERFSCMIIATLDIDGFRIDKAVQVTVDAQAAWSKAMRECALRFGKKNFMVVGEITSGNFLGSIYLGRGRTPNVTQGLSGTKALSLKVNDSADAEYFIRGPGDNALDAGAFHYSVYRYLTRFLGLSGNLEAGYDLPPDWVEIWNNMMTTNDLYNAFTGQYDPRHLYGVANQDVFRWPAITYGTERMLLGYFITTLMLPGSPLIYYGEEQNFYILDNTADNYVFGRQAFAPTPAWKVHGCYSLNNSIYTDWPVRQALHGCHDPATVQDHRDPSAPIRNIMKRMFQLRDAVPVLERGWLLQQLQKNTSYALLPGSTVKSEFGIWSVARGWYASVQQGADEKGTPVWLVYHNKNTTETYLSDCNNASQALVGPFDAGKQIRDLIDLSNPNPVITIGGSSIPNNFTGAKANMGCFSNITLAPFEFRAYVPVADWPDVKPAVTGFWPGHDVSIDTTDFGGNSLQKIELRFSTEMDCQSINNNIFATLVTSGANNGTNLTISNGQCFYPYTDKQALPYVGYVPSVFKWNATIQVVADGIMKLTLVNASSTKNGPTNSIDHFLLRFGKPDNPVVWPERANYSRTLLTSVDSTHYHLNLQAPGATLWRYSTNWGSSWSNWQTYAPMKDTLVPALPWTGTTLQSWQGPHIIVQYFSKPLGSSAFIQHGDAPGWGYARTLPHVHLHGAFNKWGFDAGLPGSMDLVHEHTWELHFMAEWPADFQFNIWGINPDNQPDATFIYGDIDDDGVLDRLPPSSLTNNVINITGAPPMPYLSWNLRLNDATFRVEKVPQGSIWIQIIILLIMLAVPVLTAVGAVWVYVRSFYQVKVNKSGFQDKGWLPLRLGGHSRLDVGQPSGRGVEMSAIAPTGGAAAIGPLAGDGDKRTVLIATMEYNIDDFKIKIKIGGLGVMAQLMATALTHLNLIWVVPVVGDVEYPFELMQAAESMFVNVMEQPYEIHVYYYQSKNITYVVLDAPIFRKQTKADPYVARMDDIESAILYAAWNSCIAETIRRFPVDIYHINDYHGAAAPLYLLPRTIPVCLSLHNAEFQGLWPMRTPAEAKEVCDVFNLPPDVVKEYVQYGSVFNLLHAGASYLRIHQRGFGAVGVSRKYGDRSLARYPIFWSLKQIGQLPNPDPSDTAAWDPKQDPMAVAKSEKVDVDPGFEQKRASLRSQAQEWAGLDVDPTAELFVFVGRWSLQKGIDLIADIFPCILEKYPKTQLICIGPVIDLYGRFAALKLDKLTKMYPGRVYIKPEFTQLPPYIFSGAEFALIPSRDEPFGLVAVEFGRKGALGVGARVGGLGQMPGFWYTIESMSPSHLLQQFRQAIVSALGCKTHKRAIMRAWSAKQRFPVAQWVKQLDELHGRSIRIHNKEAKKKKNLEVLGGGPTLNATRPSSRGSTHTYVDASGTPAMASGPESAALSPLGSAHPRVISPLMGRPLSPGAPMSPGHHLPTPTVPWAMGPDLGSPRDSIASSIGGTSRMSTISVDSLAVRAQNGGYEQPQDAFQFQLPTTPFAGLGVPQPNFGNFSSHRNSSMLSLPDVVGDRHDLKLQKVDQFFNDTNGEFYAEFGEKLEALTAKNSASDLCIETFLKKSEKEWFARYRDAKLGRHQRDASRNRSSSRPPSPGGSKDRRNASVVSRGRQRYRSRTPSGLRSEFESDSPTMHSTVDDEFLLGDGYQAPKGLRKMLSIRVGDWPIYSFFLAIQQIISINSYELVLLTGETSQTPTKLYIISGSYLSSSIIWYVLVRSYPSVYALSIPWFFFGAGFLLLGISPLIGGTAMTLAVTTNTASALYSAGASSGALSFALNFGDEGGSPTRQWIMRALIVAGFQQLYSLMLWYWGSLVSNEIAIPNGFLGNSPVPEILVICVPIAVIVWAIGVVLYLGLPDFYRQSPVSIPGFYISLYRRKIVPWFMFMIMVQNFWLSAPLGRSWQFLFSSQFIPSWGVVLLALGFFVGLWSVMLWGLTRLSNQHTWLLPIFAVGLCAPRWAQELWATSGLGSYLPWARSAVLSAILSRCLWLWLGLLDNVQGVGLGMMLLATLTRQHVLAVLVGAQVVGSAFTMLARAVSPNSLSPNTTFPDFSRGLMPGIASPWFWTCLMFQLIIPIGFFKFFRKEQVSKP